jgi:phospholipase C
MAQPLLAIGAASDGSVFGIDPNQNILQAVPSALWTPVPGQPLSDISAGSDGPIWGIAAPGQVYSYSGGAFAPVPNSAPVTHLSVGRSDTIWAVDQNNLSYKYVAGTGFVAQPGSAIAISVGFDRSVWGIDTNGIAEFISSSGAWQSIASPGETLVSISAGSAGWVWALGPSGVAYQYEGATNQWVKVSSALSTPLRSISCGADGAVWALDGSGNSYVYDLNAQTWVFMTSETGGVLSVISVANENLVWGIDTGQNVFQLTMGGRVWNTIATKTSYRNISVASANNIWLLDANGNAFQATGGPSNWNPALVAGGPFSAISAAGDGTVYGIANSVLMQYMGSGTGWINAGCTIPLAAISAGSATRVWALAVNSNTYKFEGGASWKNIEGLLSAISASADDQVWGIDSASGGNACFYTGEGWFPTPKYLGQISAGNVGNVWGIDATGNAVAVIPSVNAIGEGSLAKPGPQARASVVGFDTESPFIEEQSSHLWIVNRAADLAQSDPSGNGQKMFALMQPYKGEIGDPFHDGWCQGLYAPDFVSPWCGPGKGFYATYAAHFYDPRTGKNWLYSKSWTAVVVGNKLFWESLQAYADGNLAEAGYKLGMSLHYLTDLTQPMHSSSFTYLSSSDIGYHTAFESLVLETQSQYSKPAAYTPSSFTDPSEFFLSAAENSSANFFSNICPPSIALNYDVLSGLTDSQRDAITPFIGPILNASIMATSQYLVFWYAMTQFEISTVYLISRNSGLAIDVPGGNKGAGQQLQQYPWNNTGAQRFTLVAVNNPNDGTYNIKWTETSPANVLDYVPGQNSSVFNVVLNPPSQSSNPNWKIEKGKDESLKIYQTIQNLQGLVTVNAPCNQTGAPLIVQPESFSAAQEWLPTPAAPVYIQLAASNPILVCDVVNASGSAGAQLQLYNQKSGENAQAYLFVPLIDDDAGYHMILNPITGLAVTAAWGSVYTDSWNNSDAQKWQQVPVPNSNGIFVLLNKATGYLSSAANPAAGMLLHTQPSQNIALAWTLTPASLYS